MEEQSKELNKIIVYITLFLLNTNNIGGMVRFIFGILHMFIPRKEAKLKKILDNNSHL